MPTDFLNGNSASDSADLLVLADSSFPSGSHGHSTGLEYAIQNGWVVDAASLEAWGQTALKWGIIPCDGRALARAWLLAQASIQSDPTKTAQASANESLSQLNQELAALRPGMVQREGSAQVGRSFCRSSLDAWGSRAFGAFDTETILHAMKEDADFIQYPIAWGIVCSGLCLPLSQSLSAYLVSCIRQMMQVAVRIMNIGQREALAVQARLGTFIASLKIDANAEADRRLESSAFRYDSAGLGHESLQRRYFRT